MKVKSKQFTSHSSKKCLVFILACLALLLPTLTEASSYGSTNAYAPRHLSFNVTFILAAAYALPGALIGMVLEWLSAKHRPPVWLGLIAVVLVLYYVVSTVGIDPRNQQLLFLIPIPPLTILALVAFVSNASLRGIMTLSMAVLSVAIGIIWLQSTTGILRGNSGLFGVLLGGSVVSTSLWLVGYYLGCRSRKRQIDNDGV